MLANNNGFEFQFDNNLPTLPCYTVHEAALVQNGIVIFLEN